MGDRIRAVPEGYTTVTPWIIVNGVDGFLDFVVDALGAEELGRVHNEDGTIGHAEVRIGDAVVMMFDSSEGWPETPQFLRLYVDDAKAVVERAVAAGATPVTDVTPLAFGDQVGRFSDPWGNLWWVQERLEELSGAEIGARMAQPAYAEAMRYLRESLDAEMRRRERER